MVNLSITIYTCCASFFMFMNKNLKETAFNYCAQWSGVDGQKTNFFIISMGVMFHTIKRLPPEGMAFTKRNAQPLIRKFSETNKFNEKITKNRETMNLKKSLYIGLSKLYIAGQ